MSKDKEIISDRVEAYRKILESEQHGNVNALPISRELFRNFCLVGYFQRGIDGQEQKRWKLTNFGRSQMKAYLALVDQIKEVEQRPC